MSENSASLVYRSLLNGHVFLFPFKDQCFMFSSKSFSGCVFVSSLSMAKGLLLHSFKRIFWQASLGLIVRMFLPLKEDKEL